MFVIRLTIGLHALHGVQHNDRETMTRPTEHGINIRIAMAPARRKAHSASRL